MDKYYEELRVALHVERMGNDLCVAISGGDQPHIGSIAIAEPRLSMNGDGHPSATVSTFNFPGHKDDEVANIVSKEISIRLNCRVVAVCGLHYNSIDTELFAAVQNLTGQIVKDVCEMQKP